MSKIHKDKPALLLSIPNMLTYARILAVPVVVLCFYLEGKLQSSDFARWSALAIFVLASITDFFDGYLARIWKQTSNIGRMLDPIADKLLVATCLLLLAADTDKTIAGWSLWAAIIILCREILVSGLGREMENHGSDDRHRVPACRFCRRQGFPLHYGFRVGVAMDGRLDYSLYRLRLFPCRCTAHY